MKYPLQQRKKTRHEAGIEWTGHTNTHTHYSECCFPSLSALLWYHSFSHWDIHKNVHMHTSPQPASTIWPSQGSDVSGVRWAVRGTLCAYALCVHVCVWERNIETKEPAIVLSKKIRTIQYTAIFEKPYWEKKNCTDHRFLPHCLHASTILSHKRQYNTFTALQVHELQAEVFTRGRHSWLGRVSAP